MEYDDLFDDYHLDFDLPDTNYDIPSYDIDSILDTDISDSLYVPETEIELDTFDNYSPGTIRANNNNDDFNNSPSSDNSNYDFHGYEISDETCQIIYRSRSDTSVSDDSSLSDYSSSYSSSLSSSQSSDTSDKSDSSVSSIIIIIIALLILILLLQISRRGGKMYG